MSDVQRSSRRAPARSDDDISYTKEAFFNNWNLAFLAVAFLSSVLTFSALQPGGGGLFLAILIFSLVSEALYLGLVPRRERFRRAVRSRKLAGRQQQRRDASQKETYRQLSRRSQRRYARLRQLEDAIEANYEKLSGASQELLRNHLRKIDGLLEAHLNLLLRRERYQGHAEAATESEVRRSIEVVRDRLEEASPRVREVKERRLRILKQRLRRFREGNEHREVIEAQLQTIEDVVRYIHEQSWSLHDPEEISHQLDSLLDEVEETQQSVQEVEEVFTRSPEELLDEVSRPEGRSRQRN